MPSDSPDSWLARRLRSGGQRRLAVPRTRLGGLRQPSAGDWQRRHLIVCGDDPLAQRLIEELVTRYRFPVTVIMSARRRNHGPQIARLPVRIVKADRLDGEAFRQAGLRSAAAVALVQQDDVGNIHAALQAQEINPRVRLVIRMFNMSLGYGIRRLFSDCAVLSDASMAAPEFVAAALGEVAPVHVRVPGRTLYVARRADVRPADIVCGLAAASGSGQPDLLPVDQSRADLVLVQATGLSAGAHARPVNVAELSGKEPFDDDDAASIDAGLGAGCEPAAVRSRLLRRRRRRRPGRFSVLRRWLRRHRRSPFGALRALIDRKLRTAAIALIALLILATGVLGLVKGISWWDAAYLTLLTALGGANPDVQTDPAEKITQTVLSIVSIALIPVITAAIVEAVVNARLALALGRLKRPISDHVVVIGLGNVGTRVIRQLHELGFDVVAIDKSESARGTQLARELNIPLVAGDASRVETLRAASVQTCRALVALSTDDVTNLEAALHGRTLQKDLRVVLRLFDGDFADRVQKAFSITSSCSVSFLAAPAFAAAMLEREVIGTIPVNRQVLLIAEVPVCAGSRLDGAPLTAANDVGEGQVIALTPAGSSWTQWPAPAGHRLAPGDQLVVVTTRSGLGRLLARTAEADHLDGGGDPVPPVGALPR